LRRERGTGYDRRLALFVTFEGIEGSGKSTHLRHLVAHLRATGRDVVETREPGGTPAGAHVRRLLLGEEAIPLVPIAELLLYCADRAQHLAEVVRPALAAGRIVVCDRFSDSTVAYQGHGRRLDLATIRALDAHARGDLTPQLTFLLDCPVAEGLARAHSRGPTDRFEREAVEFHERVRAGFLALAAESPDRYCVLQSTEPMDVVRAQVIAETEARLAGTRGA
jgi:dTMP kinase